MAPNEYRRPHRVRCRAVRRSPAAPRAVRKNIRQDYAGRFEYNVAIERPIGPRRD